MAFVELQEHRGVAALRNNAAGRRVRLEPMLAQVFVSLHTPYAIFAAHDEMRPIIGVLKQRMRP